MKKYVLDKERAREYFRLCYPDWSKELALPFLLFLDYRIQGGEGSLSFYGKERIYMSCPLYFMAHDEGLLPLDLADELEKEADNPKTIIYSPIGFDYVLSYRPWEEEVNNLERLFMERYKQTRLFSAFFEVYSC